MYYSSWSLLPLSDPVGLEECVLWINNRLCQVGPVAKGLGFCLPGLVLLCFQRLVHIALTHFAFLPPSFPFNLNHKMSSTDALLRKWADLFGTTVLLGQRQLCAGYIIGQAINGSVLRNHGRRILKKVSGQPIKQLGAVIVKMKRSSNT